jgi:hypothetical protein
MICHSCGIEAPTMKASFYQNIGALVVRWHKSVNGRLCKNCINKSFRDFTLTTLFLGWWGVLSFILTPIFLINNIFYFIKTRKLAPVPLAARKPTLTEGDIERIKPHAQDIILRLNANEDLDDVSKDVAMRAGVTPGQVAIFVIALAQAAQNNKNV